MKFVLFVLPTVPATFEERKRLRPIGRSNERDQQMLDELRKLAVFAEEVGFDVFATTEHHSHSEVGPGFVITSAVSVSPRRSACPRTPKDIRRRRCCRSPRGRPNGFA